MVAQAQCQPTQPLPQYPMPLPRTSHIIAVVLSLGLHALVLVLIGKPPFTKAPPQDAAPAVESVIVVEMAPPALPPQIVAPPKPAPRPPTPTHIPPATPAMAPAAPTSSGAYMEAPPPPSSEEWALAATYTLKNSKRYRHNWGQQVRSMMGTAFEGPDQGAVRFRIEIAPNGTLARLDTLWSTSAVAEQRARQAVQSMPPLPPTPTGQPLVFEKTISFQPFAADDAPIYKYDCEPDRPAFSNPYAWDGRSPTGQATQPTTETLDPTALAECLKQLPQDTIDAEHAHNQRQLRQ